MTQALIETDYISSVPAPLNDNFVVINKTMAWNGENFVSD
jgi:hypothetical protein